MMSFRRHHLAFIALVTRCGLFGTFAQAGDDVLLFSPQEEFEAESFTFQLMAGSPPSFEEVSGSTVPFSKVALSTSRTEFASDYIPVKAGETLYGEIWAMRLQGSSGAAGSIYYGVARYDKDKKPIASNSGLAYFAASNRAVPQTGEWQKYSGTTYIPKTHAPYGGSDGGPVRYVRAYVIVNYSTGSIPTYWGGIVLRRLSPFSDSGPISLEADLTIGTGPAQAKLHVNHSESGYDAANVTGLFVENNGASNDFFAFQTATLGGGKSFSITNAGNVGIGTASPKHALDVNGTIRAKEIIVEVHDHPDYVFDDDYLLRPLEEVEAHITSHRRLPGMPSAEEVKERGLTLGESQRLLLEKVEELTLYVLQLKVENRRLAERVHSLENGEFNPNFVESNHD